MLQIHITGIEQPVERWILALYEDTSDVRGDDGYAKQDKSGEEEHQGNYRCPARDGVFKNKMVDQGFNQIQEANSPKKNRKPWYNSDWRRGKTENCVYGQVDHLYKWVFGLACESGIPVILDHALSESKLAKGAAKESMGCAESG